MPEAKASIIPEPSDPIIGIIMGQGHVVFHIGFTLAAILLRNRQGANGSTVICKSKTKGVYTYDVNLDGLMENSYSTHSMCAVLLLVSIILKAINVRLHVSVLLATLTIPIYQFFIFDVWQKMNVGVAEIK